MWPKAALTLKKTSNPAFAPCKTNLLLFVFMHVQCISDFHFTFGLKAHLGFHAHTNAPPLSPENWTPAECNWFHLCHHCNAAVMTWTYCNYQFPISPSWYYLITQMCLKTTNMNASHQSRSTIQTKCNGCSVLLSLHGTSGPQTLQYYSHLELINDLNYTNLFHPYQLSYTMRVPQCLSAEGGREERDTLWNHVIWADAFLWTVDREAEMFMHFMHQN